MLLRYTPLRSLSAALVLSTSLSAVPALAVDATYGPGPLTGPIDLGPIDIFHSGASLTSTSYGFEFSGDLGNGTLTSGSSISANGDAFNVDGAVTGTLTNSGTISSLDGRGVHIAGNVTGLFINGPGGRISGADGDGVAIDGAIASFINNGTISASGPNSTSGDNAAAVRIGQPLTGTFTNTGTIESENGWGINMRPGRLVNTGTIKGTTGINSDGDPNVVTTLVNSGTIQGTDGTAFYLGDNDTDDTVVLLTGSRIFGTMGFGGGADTDTLDISGFRGNAVMTVDSLETIIVGKALVNDQRDGNGDGTLSVVDATGITSGGSASLGEVAGTIGGEIAGALSGQSGGFAPTEPLGYAPSRPAGAAEAAADELVASAEPTGPEIWGKVFAGVTNKTSDYNAVLGGIVAGSHTSVDANTRLGGVLSVSSSRFATVGGQAVTSTIGAAGLYGSTDLGGPVLSYSILGGIASNHSDRTVTAMVTETARADFASWFWSPELGISIPVAVLDAAETSAGFKLRYVGGSVGSYAETGSSQNLSVGTAAVNLLDARLELTGKVDVTSTEFGDVMLYATAGVLAQQNFGSSVSIAGFPIAQVPASFAYGAYSDVTVEAPIGPSSKASAAAGFELRSDGVASAVANLGLSAVF